MLSHFFATKRRNHAFSFHVRHVEEFEELLHGLMQLICVRSGTSRRTSSVCAQLRHHARHLCVLSYVTTHVT